MSEALSVKSEKFRRRQRRVAWLAALFALYTLLFALTACKADLLPQGREIEGMELLRVLGVDAEAGSGVTVTATGGEARGEPPKCFSGRADTISGACLALQGGGESYLFLGHVGHLLLGEPLARRKMNEVLDYVERDPEMRLDTALFVVKGGEAAEVIAIAAEGQAAAPMGELTHHRPLFRTVKDVLEDLAGHGASFTPAVAVGDEGGLVGAGYAIIKEGALVGWAEGDAARGVDLILGQTEADLLELALPGGEKAALRLVDAKTRVTAVFRGETLVGLELDCVVEANVAQAPAGLDMSRGDESACLQVGLSSTVERRVRRAVEVAQTLDADFLGLVEEAGISAPWHWATLQEQWGATFATLPVVVRVEGTIQRGYDVK